MNEPDAFKDALARMKGKTIEGYATGAVNGQLDSLTLTFSDGSSATLQAGELTGWIDVEFRSPDWRYRG